MMNNVKRLPDAYLKRYGDGTKSNHAKMLELNELQRDEFKEVMTQVLESLDIDIATGATLDKFGETINQKRGSLNDEQYRIMLRFKIAKLLNKGDYNSLMTLACFLLECEYGDLVVQDVGNATIEIVSLPLAVLHNAGFTFSQVIDMIKDLIPCGVNISDANFIGKFEFGDWNELLSDEENEALLYDEGTDFATCFADAEETLGGYLGHVTVDERDEEGKVILPT